jgi:hypothetical protein
MANYITRYEDHSRASLLWHIADGKEMMLDERPFFQRMGRNKAGAAAEELRRLDNGTSLRFSDMWS